MSHDRALIDAVATHTLSIEDGGAVMRAGGYADLLRARAEAQAAAPAAAAGPARRRAAASRRADAAARRAPPVAHGRPAGGAPAGG